MTALLGVLLGLLIMGGAWYYMAKIHRAHLGISQPAPVNSAPMPVGMWDAMGLIGQGPDDIAGLTPGLKYGAALGIVNTILPSNATALTAVMDAAEATNTFVVFNLVHSPSTFVDANTPSPGCNQFSQTKYLAWLDLVAGSGAINTRFAAFLLAKKGACLVADEPQISYYCGSFTNTLVNSMGLAHKSRWPGCITIVRASLNVFNVGTEPPVTGWSGIDYGIPQYGKFPTGSSQNPGGIAESAVAYFARMKAGMALVAGGGVKVLPGLNLWSGGGGLFHNSDCWDYKNDNISSGRVHSTITTGITDGHSSGDADLCAAAINGTYWQTAPVVIKETIDACYNDPDFPIFLIWTHILSNFSPNQPYFSAQEKRSDIRAALNYCISRGATRTASNGWTAK